MTTSGAEQLTLAGLAPRKRRKRASAEHTPAEQHPIAQVVLDVQALHLGQTFDYFIDEKDSEAAQPGVLVRVRFGGQRVSGVIWARTDTSDTPRSSIRYIERVLSPDVLVPASMREDIGLIAKAYGGTRANILRFAVPPRVAKVEAEQRLAASFRRPVGGSLPDNTQGGFAGRGTNPDGTMPAGSTFAVASTVSEGAAQGYRRLTANYADVNVLHDALTGQRFQSFVFDSLPGAQEWQRNMAWMVATALSAGKAAVVELPTMREVEDLMPMLRNYGLKPFAPAPAGGRLATVLHGFHVGGLEACLVHEFARQQVGVAGVDDGHATGHLVHDDLDVLVVDIHTLGAVHGVHFLHDVDLGGALAEDGEDLLGVHRTFDQLGADLDVVAVGNLERHALGDLVGDRLDHAVFLRCAGIGVRGQDDLATAIVLHDLDAAGELGDRGLTLRGAGLEKLGDTGKTLGDIGGRGHTTGVEGTQRQLGTRLTDGLDRKSTRLNSSH